jgi:hypothetical protein
MQKKKSLNNSGKHNIADFIDGRGQLPGFAVCSTVYYLLGVKKNYLSRGLNDSNYVYT